MLSVAMVSSCIHSLMPFLLSSLSVPAWILLSIFMKLLTDARFTELPWAVTSILVSEVVQEVLENESNNLCGRSRTRQNCRQLFTC